MELLILPVITIICYIFAEIIKIIFPKNETIKKLIPFIVSVIGGFISLLIYITNKELLGTINVWDTLLIGIMSGLSSTGTNQIIQKIKKIRGE